MFTFLCFIMSVDSNYIDDGKALLITFSIRDDSSVKLDDNRGCICDFC